MKKEKNVHESDKLKDVSINRALLNEYLGRVTYKLEMERKEIKVILINLN